ncbi:PepSY domain-containing protein [Streptomyces sp. NPDC048392]|uniref:PepSY domain-containing protein n=1 Tax=Streptomyces sp. NPDC048392 TaxID=3365543 RepID=UPI00372362E8
MLSGDGTRHSVRVDPATGKVLALRTDEEDGEDTAEARSALRGASVTAAEAAQAAAGRGTVTSVDLDDDGGEGDGGPAWEVETRAPGKGEQDWRAHLRTGKVTTASHGSDSHDSGDSGSDDD